MSDQHLNAPLSIKSSDPDINFSKFGNNLTELIKMFLRKWSNSHLMECGTTGMVYTYENVLQSSQTFAANLRKLPGMKNGAVVAVVLPNSLEFIISLLGIWEAGCIACPLNPQLTQREILHIFTCCKPVCAVASNNSQLNFLESHKDQMSLLKTVIAINDETKDIESSDTGYDSIKFSSMLREVGHYNDNNVTSETEKAKASDVAAILACYQRDEKIRQELERKSGQDVEIFVIPMSHCYGMCIFMAMICQGGKAIVYPKYSTEMFIQAIMQHKPTKYHAVPPMVYSMINNPALRKEHLEMAHTVTHGGAGVNDSILERFIEKFGNRIFLRQLYGLTETTIAIIIDSGYGNIKKVSIGRLLSNLSAKVVNCSTGENLGPNGVGELCIKGPAVMKGYLNNDEATKQIMDSDGFLHTGDMAFYDEDGFFYIVDRIKDVIKVKGFHVSPSEIEEQLIKLDGIVDVAVVGIPYKSTVAPRAYIVTNGNTLTEDQIHSFVRKNLASYKQLDGGIEFVKDIPRSPSGKILKKKLLEGYLAHLH